MGSLVEVVGDGALEACPPRPAGLGLGPGAVAHRDQGPQWAVEGVLGLLHGLVVEALPQLPMWYACFISVFQASPRIHA